MTFATFSDPKVPFTPDEARALAGSINPASHKAMLKLVATADDNTRLRALIKSVEWDGINDVNAPDDPGAGCPWCSAAQYPTGKHAADCPAFTVEGLVR